MNLSQHLPKPSRPTRPRRPRILRPGSLNVLFALLSSAVCAIAQTVSPIQSSADPFGLPITGQVQLAGSDADAATFQTTALPILTQFINQNLSETKKANHSAMRLDPSKLFLANAPDVRIYFVGEGAGYHNTLGFNPTGAASRVAILNSSSPTLPAA